MTSQRSTMLAIRSSNCLRRSHPSQHHRSARWTATRWSHRKALAPPSARAARAHGEANRRGFLWQAPVDGAAPWTSAQFAGPLLRLSLCHTSTLLFGTLAACPTRRACASCKDVRASITQGSFLDSTAHGDASENPTRRVLSFSRLDQNCTRSPIALPVRYVHIRVHQRVWLV